MGKWIVRRGKEIDEWRKEEMVDESSRSMGVVESVVKGCTGEDCAIELKTDILETNWLTEEWVAIVVEMVVLAVEMEEVISGIKNIMEETDEGLRDVEKEVWDDGVCERWDWEVLNEPGWIERALVKVRRWLREADVAKGWAVVDKDRVNLWEGDSRVVRFEFDWEFIVEISSSKHMR